MAETALESAFKTQLEALLHGGQAHAALDEAAANMPFDKQGTAPAGLPYSPWQLLEHIRIAQRDILDYCNNANGSYKPLKWPDEYWPESPVPPSNTAWQESVRAIGADRAAFEALLAEQDLTEPFAWADNGQNLLREALLIADHESYHVGELIVTRRLLGAWHPREGHA